MDPNATLRAIRVAAHANDKARLKTAVSDLRNWIAKGGFEPEWESEFERDIVLLHLEPKNSQFTA
jgi:thiamine biosynthesis protein ThiC